MFWMRYNVWKVCSKEEDQSGLRIFFICVVSVRMLPKLHKFLPKFWTMPDWLHNGIFLFVRSQLTVCVMYWARVEDYFYPFHKVCNASIVNDGSGFTKTWRLLSTESLDLWMIRDLVFIYVRIVSFYLLKLGSSQKITMGFRDREFFKLIYVKYS